MMKTILCAIALGLFGQAFAAEPRHAIGFDDLMSLGRVSDPQVSPDGAWVAFTVARYSKEKNSGDSDVWLVPAAGGTPRQLTRSERRDNNPRWGADGRQLAFISSRDGTPQVWVMDLSGGDARRLTSLSTGADGVIWSRDGSRLAFTSDVYPDCADDNCNRRRAEAADSSKVKAKIVERLLYRHWDSWKDGRRTHVFTVPALGGVPVDCTPGDHDAPPFSLGGPTDYDLSPDGKELCFASNTDRVEAVSTNSDLWIVPASGGTAKRITANPAYDGSPLYSPDGKYIAYRAQRRPGFESDRFELLVYDRASGESRSLTGNLDRHVGGFDWAPDSGALCFTAEENGYSPVYRVSIKGGDARIVVDKSSNDDVKVARKAGLVFTRQSISRPSEVYRADLDGRNAAPLTRTNESVLGGLDLGTVESMTYAGADDTPVQAWLVRPPGFAAGKRYPAIVLIHGGPQGVWGDAWSYRWNIQMLAARGYVVFAPNPRGSFGFGQRFTDQISGDWGGKVYEDIMKGVDALTRLEYVDGSRLAAAGGSFGGYMVNWIAGHTTRFRALVSHAGVFNLESMYGVTEELWFPEWEFRGTPWMSREQYTRFSPSQAIASFRTPTLVVHGELDYRVPIGEGLQMFTALQRMNVPSKLLYYPDEGHWVLKPQNSELWYRTVLDWIDRYTKNVS
jgi:dipeptidyl aminopeptidase/acylaminoacyl peptidase